MPEELWTEVHDIVQEAVIKTMPKKKKYKKAKWLSEEALQIAEKRREAKGKGKIPKVMLKILQARLQLHVNRELPDVQAGFRQKQRNQRSNSQHPLDHGSSRKTSPSALLTMPKLLTVWSQQTVENFSRDGNTRPPDLPPEKSVCRSRSNS